MDNLELEIKKYFLSKNSPSADTQRRWDAFPTEKDFYLYLTDQLGETDEKRMLEHLKNNTEDRALVLKARELFFKASEAQSQVVPASSLEKVKALIPGRIQALCPHCHQAITPFKKPLSKQKAFNLLFLVLAGVFFGGSFLFPRFFIQWVALGTLCAIKWIVDQKSTKTQIMIYKALTEELDRGSNRIGEELKKF